MIQRATTADPVLDRITRPIVEQFHPRRIILFGSRARGDARADSDYDVLVEMDTELNHYACLTALSGAVAHPRGFELNIFLRKPGRLEERRDDPGTMDWHIAREGIVLYAADGGSLGPLPTWPSRVRERGARPPESVREWVRRAEHDLLAVENSLAAAKPAWGAVAFHAQQATEKYLKAVLVARHEVAPRTHVLSVVVAAIRQKTPNFPEFAVQCELLQPYAVGVRYPEETPIPDEATARAALQGAREMIAAARSLIPPPQET